MPSLTLPVKDQRLDGRHLAIALGVGDWMIHGIKKANRLLAEQGREELIFAGRYSTPAKVAAWLDAHPGFVASQVLDPRRAAKSRAQHDTLSHQRV